MDFNAAVEKSKTLNSPSNDDLLSLYKYYKQVRGFWMARDPGFQPLALLSRDLLLEKSLVLRSTHRFLFFFIHHPPSFFPPPPTGHCW
jgi:hypothetical protein